MPPRTFFSSKNSDDDRWKKTIIHQEVSGECSKCKGRKALWTVYGDHSETLRCLKCNSTSSFVMDTASKHYNDPHKFPPFADDEDNGEGKRKR